MKQDPVLEKLLELQKQNLQPHQMAPIVGMSRYAIIGKLYRHKVKNGYVPTRKNSYDNVSRINKNFKRDFKGERDCNVCAKPFHMFNKYDRFCDICRKVATNHTSWMT